jgi:hypothetical protein
MNALLQPSDINFLESLKPHVRTEAHKWHNAFHAVSKPITASLQQLSTRFGVPFETARRKYYAWLTADKSITSLVNKAKQGKTNDDALSADFICWFKKKAERNQRVSRSEYFKFVRAWQSGAHIPGLDNTLPRHVLPPGCSYANLMRKVKDAFARDVMRRGLSYATAKHGPQIFSTRAELWYLSHLMIDDLWHDNFVVFGKQIVRVLELDALDVFSGCLITFGTKPRFRREDGSFDNLKEKFARLIVASVFFNEGFAPRGTTILAEHGTAAVSDHVARILYDFTGGKIVLRESGITEKEQAVAGWRGQGKGNPRFKAALESIRNLKHNLLGDVAGQTGKDRDHRPEYTHGQLEECADLLKAITVLAEHKPERARQIQLNLLQYHSEFLPLLVDCYDFINARTWHDLEGWHQAGHVLTEYRVTPQERWLTDAEFSNLPVALKSALLETAQSDPRFLQSRKMSPTEVRNRHRHELIKIPPFLVGDLLGPDYATELNVHGAYFDSFKDQDLSPEALQYESVVITPDGQRAQLRDDKYMVFVNPFDLSHLFVHGVCRKSDPSSALRHQSSALGPCLGVAKRVTRVNPADLQQLNAAFGYRNQRLAELKAPIAARHADLVQEATDRARHNAAVLQHAGIDRDEALPRPSDLSTLNHQPSTSSRVIEDQLSRTTETAPTDPSQQWE